MSIATYRISTTPYLFINLLQTADAVSTKCCMVANISVTDTSTTHNLFIFLLQLFVICTKSGMLAICCYRYMYFYYTLFIHISVTDISVTCTKSCKLAICCYRYKFFYYTLSIHISVTDISVTCTFFIILIDILVILHNYMIYKMISISLYKSV